MSAENLEDENFTSDNSAPRDLELRAAKTVHKSLVVETSDSASYIIVVAVCVDSNKNFINRITCKKGVPIQGYIYDSQTDSYLIECADFFHLGFIPVSYVVKQNGIYAWEVHVPMPESIIKRHLLPQQKKELQNFKKHFNSKEYMISYVQMVFPN